MTTTIPRASAILGAARTLAAKLLLAVPIDRAALSQAMTESAGGSDAAGAWQQRDSFEALEVALSLAIPELVGRMEVGAAIGTLEALNHLNMVRTIGAPRVSPAAVAAVLNSDIVDQVFRCISGSVAVSAFELESIPLPPAAAMAPIEKLVANGASRAMIEKGLRCLYGVGP